MAASKETYAVAIEPWANLFVLKVGVCFSCLGMGTIAKCAKNECAVEATIREIEGGRTIWNVCDTLGDLLRLTVRGTGLCGYCYMPAAKGNAANFFHPDGMFRKDHYGRINCKVRASAALKALAVGSRLWRQAKEGIEEERAGTDPEWLTDVLTYGKSGEGASLEDFARVLEMECGKERWLMRVLYHMMKEAVEKDEARGGRK